jgi:putative cardiolipin synthase
MFRRRTGPRPPLWRRLLRFAGWSLVALAILMVSGVLLADHLTPRATGTPSRALAVQPAQTELDREVEPLLETHPGMTGVLAAHDGLDAFAMRALATRKAGRSLDLMYFIWKDDLAGRLLAREVHAAAARGVRVRVLLDDINLSGLESALLALDAHANIELRVYNPFRNRAEAVRVLEMLQRFGSLNHRMHNKAWIADNRVAVVGGRNIGEAYFSAADVNFRDLDLLLFGPAVAQASQVFDAYWNSAAAVPVAALHPGDPNYLRMMIQGAELDAAEPRAAPYLARVEASRGVTAYHARRLATHWTDRLRIVADPPMKGRDGAPRCGLDRLDADDCETWMVDRIVADVAAAKREAWIITPYFVPGEDGTAVLAERARAGVHLGIVTNSLAANDVAAVHAGYAKSRDDLLAAGVRLHELRARAGADHHRSAFGSGGASLHTKAYVLDASRGFVGSFNLDPRSATLNTEMGVMFDDPVLAQVVRLEYDRLTSPALSNAVFLDGDGNVRWRDDSTRPPTVLDTEPGSTRWQRAQAKVLGWLPIDSQL